MVDDVVLSDHRHGLRFHAALSSSDFTGPRRVTLPSCVMILMLCAYMERDLSSWIALRILRVISRSDAFIFCWSAVGFDW